MAYPFTNEPLTDFNRPENVSAFRCAMDKVSAQLGRTYPLVIGGEKILSAETFESRNPANPGQVVGKLAKATPDLAGKAMASAAAAFETWRRVPYEERARYLFSAARAVRARKHELSALMVLEVGKPWDEADAETAETIDFMEFYGREMLRLGPPQPTVPSPDREAETAYIPLGAGAVIPPWNFPSALTAGMTVASIVAGNTAVLKPASSSPVVAAWLVDLLNEQLHLPPGVLSFLPGPGGAVGDALVRPSSHPFHRLHREQGSWATYFPACRGGSGRAEMVEAHRAPRWAARARSGRRDCGSRRGRRRHRALGFQLRGAEVLGLLTSDCRQWHPRAAVAEDRRACPPDRGG